MKVLSNRYKKSFVIWKLIPRAPFSAILHYHDRILASAIKWRTKKALKWTHCASGDPMECIFQWSELNDSGKFSPTRVGYSHLWENSTSFLDIDIWAIHTEIENELSFQVNSRCYFCFPSCIYVVQTWGILKIFTEVIYSKFLGLILKNTL